MLMEIVMGLFCVAMIGGGVGMILSPESFIIGANPTLELMQKHLPDWVVRRFVQGLGGFMVVAFVGYFFARYVF